MPPALLLRRTDIAEVLTADACLAAAESAFRAHVAGQTLPPAILGVPVAQGGFHVKAAGLVMSRPYFAAKTNANFPGNPARSGLPAIQGKELRAELALDIVVAADPVAAAREADILYLGSAGLKPRGCAGTR